MNDFNHYKSPPLTFEDYIQGMRKAGLPQVANLLEQIKVIVGK